MPYFFPLASGGGFSFRLCSPGFASSPLPGFPAWLCLPGGIFAAFGGLRLSRLGLLPVCVGAALSFRSGGVVGSLPVLPGALSVAWGVVPRSVRL